MKMTNLIAAPVCPHISWDNVEAARLDMKQGLTDLGRLSIEMGRSQEMVQEMLDGLTWKRRPDGPPVMTQELADYIKVEMLKGRVNSELRSELGVSTQTLADIRRGRSFRGKGSKIQMPDLAPARKVKKDVGPGNLVQLEEWLTALVDYARTGWKVERDDEKGEVWVSKVILTWKVCFRFVAGVRRGGPREYTVDAFYLDTTQEMWDEFGEPSYEELVHMDFSEGLLLPSVIARGFSKHIDAPKPIIQQANKLAASIDRHFDKVPNPLPETKASKEFREKGPVKKRVLTERQRFVKFAKAVMDAGDLEPEDLEPDEDDNYEDPPEANVSLA